MGMPDVYPEEARNGADVARVTFRDVDAAEFARHRQRCVELNGRVEINGAGGVFLWFGEREVAGGTVPRFVGAWPSGAAAGRMMDDWEAA